MKTAYGRAALGCFLALAFTGLTACSGGGSGGQEQAPQEPAPNVQDTPRTPDSSRVVYSGRVFDGYLRDAFVWLDLNNNYLPDPNEPHTLSGVGGSFSFTAKDLITVENPRAYPLMAHARAGLTLDEQALVDDVRTSKFVPFPFYLAAPPGVTNISPLTTLVKLELDHLLMDPETNPTTLTVADAHAQARIRLGTPNENLLQDYVRSENGKLYAYAKGLVTTMQLTLEQLNLDPNANLSDLPGAGAYLLGAALRQEARTVAEYVDLYIGEAPHFEDVAQAHFYEEFAGPNLILPFINPPVEYGVSWYVSHATTLGEEPSLASIPWESGDAPLDTLKGVGRVQYRWSLTGKLTGAFIDGWLAPAFALDRFQGAAPVLQFDPKLPHAPVDGIPEFQINGSFSLGQMATSRVELPGTGLAPTSLRILADTPTEYVYDDQGLLRTVLLPSETGVQSFNLFYEEAGLTPAEDRLTELVITPSKRRAMCSERTLYQYDTEGRLTSTQTTLIPGGYVHALSGLLIETCMGLAEPFIEASYKYHEDGLASICTRTRDTTDTDICRHFRYDEGMRKYEYLTEHAALDENFEDPTGNGHIIAIAEYSYRPLLEIAD